jgi:Cu/Ag efflux pump CusA
VLERAADELPIGARLEAPVFRQADFVRTSLLSVGRAMALGAVFVVVVLVSLLRSTRLALVSVVAIPLSLGAAAAVLVACGISINGMTLGGLAIAVGEVVDDAIVDVENVWRRLRENAAAPQPRPALAVIHEASLEVRGSVVHATVIVVIVLLPVLLLGGLAGRIFSPLALAYMLAIVASLAVAVTVTPAMCAVLLPRMAARGEARPSRLARALLRAYRGVLAPAIRRPALVIALAVLAAIAAAAALPRLGGRFLPEFHEGTLIARVQATPGTSLDEATRLLGRIDARARGNPVVHVAGRAGRAQLDDDNSPVHALEIDLAIDPTLDQEPEQTVVELARRIGAVPGLGFVVEGFLGERIHEVLTGETAPIVVEIVGPDLHELRDMASRVAAVMAELPGIGAVRAEAVLDTPELRVVPDEDGMRLAAIAPAEIAATVGTWLRGQHALWFLAPDGRPVEVVLAGDPELRHRDELAQLPIVSPRFGLVTLDRVATVEERLAPAIVRHQGGRPRIVVAASTRDGTLSDIAGALEQRLDAIARPASVTLVVGGEVAERRQAAWQLLAIGAAVALGVIALLSVAFASLRDAAIVLLNLPFGLVGGVAAASLAPEGVSVAGFVGFVTLFGIIARNGIMFVAHKQHLEQAHPEADPVALVLRAAEERLLPIVMTAATAGLALLPLAASSELAGSELEAPMAIIVCGGLVTSTALNLIVLPTLYCMLATRRRGRS